MTETRTNFFGASFTKAKCLLHSKLGRTRITVPSLLKYYPQLGVLRKTQIVVQNCCLPSFGDTCPSQATICELQGVRVTIGSLHHSITVVVPVTVCEIDDRVMTSCLATQAVSKRRFRFNPECNAALLRCVSMNECWLLHVNRHLHTYSSVLQNPSYSLAMIIINITA